MFATLASVAACHGVQTPTASVAPSPTVSSSTVTPSTAGDTALTQTPATPRVARCEGDRERCLRDGAPLLARVLPTVAEHPREAFEALHASPSPAARAWAACLAHHSGYDSAAEAMLSQLAEEGEVSHLAPDDARSPGARALYLARELTEALSDGERDAVDALPCAIFSWDGDDARRAFAPAHGSTRDALIAPFKQRCAAEAVGRAMPPEESQRVLAASEAIGRALFRAFPRPADGTMWTAVAIDAREALTESLLGFATSARESDAAMREVVARLAAESPSTLRLVGRFRRTAEAHTSALANGICAVARQQGQSVTGGQCQRRAYSAQIKAFTTWVGALHGR